MLYWLSIPVVFILVLIVRTLLFRPRKEQTAPGNQVEVDQARAVESFQEMIKCRTVSYDDVSMQDEREFERFRELLDERYPAVASKCEKHRIGPSGVIYHWKGKGGRDPWVLMSHYDVVPVEESMWQEAPFGAAVKNGEIWGRGTIDTKSTLLGVMEAAEMLIQDGFEPQNDLYLAFGGDEEVSGTSAQAMVDWFEEHKISPTVVDESGAIVEGVFPGVSKTIAVIGTGEKGIANIEISFESDGGHASIPPRHTPVGILAKAISAIENHQFKPTMVPPVSAMFDTIGRHAGFGMRLVFANLWCFRPLLFALAKGKGGELNALMRSTCAFTRMEGGTAWNVIPPKVSAGANLRLLNHTLEQAVKQLRKFIGNDQVRVEVVSGNGPSPYSRSDGNSWDTLKEAILQTWPGIVVSPYLLRAATDSRHYTSISDRVYRFTPLLMSLETRKTIHGHNERIAIDALVEIVAFYVRLIQKI